MDKQGRDNLQTLQTFFQEEQLKTNLADVTFFLSYTNGPARASVWQTSAQTFDAAWYKVERHLMKYHHMPKWLRIDMIVAKQTYSRQEALDQISKVKRNNYFSYGISFKEDGSCQFLEEEIAGNALLTPDASHIVGKNKPNLQLNQQNLRQYIRKKYNRIILNPEKYVDDNWTFFKTRAAFLSSGVLLLDGPKVRFGRGIRQISEHDFQNELELAIRQGGTYLANQLTPSGKFIYGYYPAYHLNLPGYNSVRHFSSAYALLETAQFTGNADFLTSAEKSLVWGLEHLTETIDGRLYVTEQLKKSKELKLGAQATAILALAKFEELTGRKQFVPQMESLTAGMCQQFIDEDGNTTHVLHSDLTVKETFRIIYYDGEALFSLLRAFAITENPQLLETGKRLMNRFIENGYEKYHDHWLSYSVNELIHIDPQPEYFEFGLKNAFNNLKFIEHRDTAYPTMLELLVAAVRMVGSLKKQPYHAELVSEEQIEKLQQVMRKRVVHELRTGIMWPELAMFFKKPDQIVGGFFARHDRFRMRIDDAEHFLSGLINFSLISDEKTDK